ncbi:hypothetical protein DFP72DRAFT_913719 [Ephemerocybe angulata]|uniref:Uncharacterized protein n=1 Tax=Ephemerocybe angulata TaxID=980116 RepID=A0A8H6HP50_9AGAR|nr:hypothetical protein DFP72DRAFT_913719 [Tulosesus angulatus]
MRPCQEAPPQCPPPCPPSTSSSSQPTDQTTNSSGPGEAEAPTVTVDDTTLGVVAPGHSRLVRFRPRPEQLNHIAAATGFMALGAIGKLVADVRRACKEIKHNKADFLFLSGEVKQLYAMLYAQHKRTKSKEIKRDIVGAATVLYSLFYFCDEVLKQNMWDRTRKKGENEARIRHYRRQFQAARDALLVKSVVDIRRLVREELNPKLKKMLAGLAELTETNKTLLKATAGNPSSSITNLAATTTVQHSTQVTYSHEQHEQQTQFQQQEQQHQQQQQPQYQQHQQQQQYHRQQQYQDPYYQQNQGGYDQGYSQQNYYDRPYQQQHPSHRPQSWSGYPPDDGNWHDPVYGNSLSVQNSPHGSTHSLHGQLPHSSSATNLSSMYSGSTYLTASHAQYAPHMSRGSGSGQFNIGSIGNANFGNNAAGGVIIQSSSAMGHSGYY